MKEHITRFFLKLKTNTSAAVRSKDFWLTLRSYIPAFIISALFIAVTLIGEGFSLPQFLLMALVLALSFSLPVLKQLKLTKQIKIIRIAFAAAAPFAMFFFVELYMHNPFDSSPMKTHILLLNLAFYYLLSFMLTALTTRTDVALTVTSLIPMALGIANNISMQARDLPIYPWDILSAKTAMTVVDNYHISFSPAFLVSTFILISIAVLSFPLNIRFKLKRMSLGIITAAISVVLFSGYS